MSGEILILDDDTTVLTILESVLTTAGYRCYPVTNPADALTLVATNERISVVLSDIYMPNMTGFQFVDRLHAQPLSRPCPRVLLLTAQPSIRTAVDALRLGVCDFLTKPIRSADLVEAMRRAMAQAAQDRADYASPSAEVERLIRQSQELTEQVRRLAIANETSVASVPTVEQDDSAPSTAALTMTASVLDIMEILRELRERYSSYKLDDVSWDLLLELARAQRQRRRLSVSGLMISTSNVSSTTLLRRINDLTDRGYVARIPDTSDARRDFVSLTPKAQELVADFLHQAYTQFNNTTAPARPTGPNTYAHGPS